MSDQIWNSGSRETSSEENWFPLLSQMTKLQKESAKNGAGRHALEGRVEYLVTVSDGPIWH
jgi:hypothetical protein